MPVLMTSLKEYRDHTHDRSGLVRKFSKQTKIQQRHTPQDFEDQPTTLMDL